MLFPDNDTDNSSGPTTGWDHWLHTDSTPAAPTPAGYDNDTAPGSTDPGAPVSDIASTDQSTWSQWLETESPAPEQPVEPIEHPMPAPRRRRRAVLFTVGAVAVAGGAVAAGVGVLMSQSATPVPQIPTPAATPPPAAAPEPSDEALGGGPGCPPLRTPELVRGNGPGSTSSGPGAILAFQHGYYTARSGVAARRVVAPDAAVSPPEVIDAGIATIPAETRYCLTITPLAAQTYTVLIAETRPDATRRNYQQEVTVARRGTDTVITRIGPVE